MYYIRERGITMEKRFYTVKELTEIMPIGATNIYKLVHSDGFPAITVNRRIIIPIDKFNKWSETALGKTIKL